MASGASGAELANIVNEAALRAVRAGRKSVTQADLEESIEVVIAGYQKKNSILTDHEKSASWPTTRSVMLWWPPSKNQLRSGPEDHYHPPALPARWATPCRWTRATTT